MKITVVGRIMGHSEIDAHALIPGTWKSVRSHCKREIKAADRIKVAAQVTLRWGRVSWITQVGPV